MKTENSISCLRARLRGIRPIMFDRYPGDNKTKLDWRDKLYVNQRGECVIPTLNMFSLLAAWNTPSVAKRFWGKDGKGLATGIMAFVGVDAEGDDPFNAVIVDENKQPYMRDDPRITPAYHVARTPQATPNPKERPVIPTGWGITMKFELQENSFINEPTLKKMVSQGGTFGLGTFRPIFGRYVVEWE